MSTSNKPQKHNSPIRDADPTNVMYLRLKCVYAWKVEAFFLVSQKQTIKIHTESGKKE